jgi:ADP-heptose:LPS heptosyltransferase
MMTAGRLPGIHKIAVLRANALGDYIFALPALDALAAAYPDAEIVLLGQPWHAEFLPGRPGPVQRAIVVPRSRGVREDRAAPGVYAGEAELGAFFAAMQAEHFDLAVQLHGGGRNSNPFLLRLGARHTAGMRTPDAPPLDHSMPYIYWQSEILRCLEVVSLVGANPVAMTPRLALTDGDVAEARAALRAAGATDDRPLAALHAGVGDGRRQWPPEKFAAVGDALAAAGCRIVLTGAGAEGEITSAVAGAMRAPAIDLCGRLSLGGLAGLLSLCAVVVSNDSGPLHVAEAVGAATVGIYWCGNLINADPLTRTCHRPHLSWRLNCPVCGRNCIDDNCEHHVSFVADVPTEDVIASALDLLAGSHGR